ncbi:MAG TPA: GAF and ANTAR domain-containing protein [Nocardioides sp.]|nr:GAF and ANTAR domain-containing protein [Nocardioides sp.]
MSEHELRIAHALNEAAKLMNAPATLDETLDAITRAALGTVPGFSHVGISITHRDGTIETKSATDQLVWELDHVQYGLHEGPCYDAISSGGITVVNEARHDQRWPRYMPEAVKRGLRAQLAVGLYSDHHSLGGLNLYSTDSDRVEDDAIGIAELFASQAAIALGRSRHEFQLNEALESRKVIGQAMGLVMEKYELDEDRAFQFLVRASSTGNIKLRDLAGELVRSANARALDAGRPVPRRIPPVHQPSEN